jgi:4-hydroxy-tetrahydrodipicolinate reductase
VARARTGMIHSPNFSLGVHIFRKVVEEAASLVDTLGLYDVRISEDHHRHKVDAPSGTAIHLAEALLSHMRSKDHWRAQDPTQENKPDPTGIFVSSTRAGDTPGTHTVSFEGELDRIELRHEALDRSVFAQGAVVAAEWVYGRSGTFTIDNLFSKDDT